MARYLDTSLLVALLIREPGTMKAQDYLSSVREHPWLISPWTNTEFSSALALKERVGTILREERLASLEEFRRFCRLRLEMVPMEAADFEQAARLCDSSRAPLQAGDALHLAVCRRNRGILATMDSALAAAAKEAGVALELIRA
jgi:predicted nucleic acid-binding protein